MQTIRLDFLPTIISLLSYFGLSVCTEFHEQNRAILLYSYVVMVSFCWLLC